MTLQWYNAGEEAANGHTLQYLPFADGKCLLVVLHHQIHRVDWHSEFLTLLSFWIQEEFVVLSGKGCQLEQSEKCNWMWWGDRSLHVVSTLWYKLPCELSPLLSLTLQVVFCLRKKFNQVTFLACISSWYHANFLVVGCQICSRWVAHTLMSYTAGCCGLMSTNTWENVSCMCVGGPGHISRPAQLFHPLHDVHILWPGCSGTSVPTLPLVEKIHDLHADCKFSQSAWSHYWVIMWSNDYLQLLSVFVFLFALRHSLCWYAYTQSSCSSLSVTTQWCLPTGSAPTHSSSWSCLRTSTARHIRRSHRIKSKMVMKRLWRTAMGRRENDVHLKGSISAATTLSEHQLKLVASRVYVYQVIALRLETLALHCIVMLGLKEPKFHI